MCYYGRRTWLKSKAAKRAGLLHDIGKVLNEPDLPHAQLGMKLAEKMTPEIINAIGAHHEIEMTTLIAPIVQACDAIQEQDPVHVEKLLKTTSTG